jgi:hypothetical protein
MEHLTAADKEHVQAVYRIAQESFVKIYRFNGNEEQVNRAYTDEIVAVVLPTLTEYLRSYEASLGVNPAQTIMRSLHVSAIQRLVRFYQK